MLVCTVAMDAGRSPLHRWMAMLMISSLQRAGYADDVMLFTDSESEPFSLGRLRVEQVRIELHGALSGCDAKFLALTEIPGGYDRVKFLDADCLVLRDPAEFLASREAVVFSEEPLGKITDPVNNAYLTREEMRMLSRPAINSGVFAVPGGWLPDFAARWRSNAAVEPLREKFCADQPSFVRTLLDCGHPAAPFGDPFSVRFPECECARIQDFLASGAVHFCGIHSPAKLGRMLGFYTMIHGQGLAPFILEMLQG